MSVVKAMTRTIPVGGPGLPLATRTYRTLMAGSTELQKLTGIAGRFGAFVAERHPLALAGALDALEAVARGHLPTDHLGLDALRPAFRRELGRRLQSVPVPPGLAETTPRTSAETRLQQAYEDILDACDGFFRRAAIQASLTPDERREILRGMILTRATDN